MNGTCWDCTVDMAVLNNSERKLAAQCLLIVNNSGALYIPPPVDRSVFLLWREKQELESKECKGHDNENVLPRVCLQRKFALAPFKKKSFMAVLGPAFCMQAFSSCGERGLLSSCGGLLLWCVGSRHLGSVAATRELWARTQ